jgi:hypothetical protein
MKWRFASPIFVSGLGKIFILDPKALVEGGDERC